MPDSKRPRPATPRASRSGVRPGPGAKPPATGSLVAQIVAEQRKQKEAMRAAMHRKDRRSNAGPIALSLLVVANVVAWLVVPPTTREGDQRSRAEVERDLRLVVASAASQVETWRLSHEGHVPPSLSAAGVADSGLTLVNVDGTVYEIRGVARDVRLAYRSNTQLSEFLDAGVPVIR